MPRENPWEAAAVRCPFYLTSGRKSILCEGQAEGIQTESHFGRTEQKAGWLRAHCSSGYEDCPVFRNAYRKYTE